MDSVLYLRVNIKHDDPLFEDEEERQETISEIEERIKDELIYNNGDDSTEVSITLVDPAKVKED